MLKQMTADDLWCVCSVTQKKQAIYLMLLKYSNKLHAFSLNVLQYKFIFFYTEILLFRSSFTEFNDTFYQENMVFSLLRRYVDQGEVMGFFFLLLN